MSNKPKPTTKTLTYLDWHECVKYLEDKYKIDIRDYAGKFVKNSEGFSGYDLAIQRALKELGYEYAEVADTLTKDMPDYEERVAIRTKIYALAETYEPPYQDFWHRICDHYEIRNPCTISIWRDFPTQFKEQWAKEIAQLFVDEFVDRDQVTFEVWW
jgi:hypothetical protein